MTKKFILGSGIVGLLAREILGDEWEIVPYGRSRFYSFKPSLADNFIVRDERIDDFITHIGGKIASLYSIKYSLGGHILPYSTEVCDLWLGKTFGMESPSRARPYMGARQVFSIYDIRINVLYEQLQNKYKSELHKKHTVTKIGDHYIIINGERVEFDKIVNTIPLNVLSSTLGINQYSNLTSRQVWYYHIKTDELDFEGSNQLLVADQYKFYKCSNIAKDRYLFECNEDLQLPGQYFMYFMNKFDLIDGTTMQNAIPCGERPNMEALDKLGVFNVGSYAEWDWCACVGSNILRLLKFKEYIKGGPFPTNAIL